MKKLSKQEESSFQSNELVQKQADEIIDIFKSIKKSVTCKYEKIAKQYGFTAQQLSVIFYLYRLPSITLNELSDHMGLTKSTVSGIVDRLAKQGVVKREIPEDNRRIVKLSISDDFKRSNDIQSMKKKFIGDFISDSIRDMDQEEVEKMIYGLRQFSIILNNEK